jgi:hypothetical protein
MMANPTHKAREEMVRRNQQASRSLQFALLLGVARDMTHTASDEALKTANEALEALETTRKKRNAKAGSGF